MASPYLDKVIDAYTHALTAVSPRYRYTVGFDGIFSLWLSYLPTFFVDWFMAIVNNIKLRPHNTRGHWSICDLKGLNPRLLNIITPEGADHLVVWKGLNTLVLIMPHIAIICQGHEYGVQYKTNRRKETQYCYFLWYCCNISFGKWEKMYWYIPELTNRIPLKKYITCKGIGELR